MTEKTVYRLSEILGSGREGAARLALIHFVEMTDEDQRSELEAIRSLTTITPDRKQKILKFMGDAIALDADDRRDLASQLREDYRNDLLSGLV